MPLALDASPAALPDIDWTAVERETVHHLQQLIRLDTTNPPGTEIATARYLDGVLRAEGIEPEIVEAAPGRASLVARLRGDGSRRALLLLAHMDVVGVEREHWSVDPFGGVVQGGYLYGRGAIDDKGMLAANLVTLLLLKRHVLDRGGTLARDVIMVASADEEAGGDFGLGWLLAHRPELVDAELALNEGGRTRVVGGRPVYLAVQTAEKVPYTVTVTAHGPGGHASVPLAGNAVFRLGRALAAIGAHREPLQLVPTTREFFRALAPVWPDRGERRAMEDLVSRDPRRIRRGAEVLARTPVFDALLRNGISATIVSGGIRENVIPTEAAASLNVRTLPGQSIDGVVARLTRVVADPLVEIRVAERGEDAPASDFASPLFAAIAAEARALAPGLAVVPYLSTGATDSARLRQRGIQCYGILPFPMEQEDEDRMHGNDERIPLASLAFGTRVIVGAVYRVAK